MRDRIATYRIQFRDEMTFDRAAELVPYLQRLGVSHLYASPIFAATSGSTHGYDVVDYNRFDEALGGRDGFLRLSDALRSAGLGLMLDIVPNHMAASPENDWWRDCAEWGSCAEHAKHFDIDWTHRLTLPVLDGPAEEVIAAGDLTFGVDEARRGLVLRYYEAAYPLTPPSYALLAEADRALAPLAEAADAARPEAAQAFHVAVAERLGPDVDAALARLSGNTALVARLHDSQPWEMTDWREARRHLSYRRFFEVTGLVGTRVEDQPVFDDVHRLTLDLVREGHVDALRIDHVDGLSDPADYLSRLRSAAGPETWIVVEKILEGDEPLRDWPIEGTTGYEFIAAMSDLLLSREGALKLETAYAELGVAPPAAQRRDAAKRQIVTHNFEGELDRLLAMIGERSDEDAGALREALIALIVALPVYRTYGDPSGFSDADLEVLNPAAAHAAEAAPATAAVVAALSGPDAWELRARFQQLTGPAMAKAVEDTLFYRHTALLAYNEVGCDPVHPPARSLDVHATLAARVAHQPYGLTATSTHDTKRGEDARARLYALSERPQDWIDGVARWRRMAEEHGSRGVPEPANEWAIYQALAGSWPREENPPVPDELASLNERFQEYIVKAMREAKLRTTWSDEDAEYEKAVTGYVDALLEPGNSEFQQDFHRALQPFALAGEVNALSQTLLKIAAPGVPDIYRGSEIGDFSLVDPDNRRPVDYEAAAAALAAASEEEGAPLDKMRVLLRGLACRRAHPTLFTSGGYRALPARGEGGRIWFAFLREHEGARAVTIVSMRGVSFLEALDGEHPATLTLPPATDGWQSAFGGQHAGGAELRLPEDLRNRSCDLLIAE